MDVFISWSGDHSRRVAVALQEWLPLALQSITPFVSDKDIHSGARWQADITGRLDACNFGIVVVTSENQMSPWLQFEAGALSKSISDAKVVPLLVDLKKTDLLLPLSIFQAEDLNQTGVESLLMSINRSTKAPMPDAIVRTLADRWWPDLKTSLEQTAEKADSSKKPERSDRELLEEVVTLLRGMRSEVVSTRPPRRRSEVVLAGKDGQNTLLTVDADSRDDAVVELVLNATRADGQKSVGWTIVRDQFIFDVPSPLSHDAIAAVAQIAKSYKIDIALELPDKSRTGSFDYR